MWQLKIIISWKTITDYYTGIELMNIIEAVYLIKNKLSLVNNLNSICSVEYGDSLTSKTRSAWKQTN